MHTWLRTAEAARASGYSVQQVRDLERLGVIPPAGRSANGYRGYTQLHVEALEAYRGLSIAIGPVRARAAMPRLLRQTMEDAAAEIDALHADLARERERLDRARTALGAIQRETTARDTDHEVMSISELSDALGVPTSTLRFWEREGLLRPERVTSLRVRRYGQRAIRDARTTAALRGAGYRIEAVRELLATLDDVDGARATDQLLGERLTFVARRSVALLRAGSGIANIVERTSAPGPP
ncbi:MerR family transcriptional regulator [soil metagenome]